jgi:hypothetical protein
MVSIFHAALFLSFCYAGYLIYGMCHSLLWVGIGVFIIFPALVISDIYHALRHEHMDFETGEWTKD